MDGSAPAERSFRDDRPAAVHHEPGMELWRGRERERERAMENYGETEREKREPQGLD